MPFFIIINKMQNAYNLIELIFKDKEKNVNLWETLKNLLNNNKDEIINFCNIMKNKIRIIHIYSLFIILIAFFL